MAVTSVRLSRDEKPPIKQRDRSLASERAKRNNIVPLARVRFARLGVRLNPFESSVGYDGNLAWCRACP